MTNEERATKMAELRASVEKAVKEYNAFMQDGKYGDAARVDATMKASVKEYTSYARAVCFDECAAESDPMLAAVKRLSFETIRLKDTTKGDDMIPVRSVETVDRQIDLLRLNTYINGGIGHDKKWPYILEQMNYQLTLYAAQELGIKPDKIKEINDSYAMTTMARAIELGETPCSNNKMLQTLTTAVQAMLGETYKPSSHDVKYLKMVYAKKSRKALTVTMANHRALRGYITDICHRIVCDRGYAVDYVQEKPKK